MWADGDGVLSRGEFRLAVRKLHLVGGNPTLLGNFPFCLPVCFYSLSLYLSLSFSQTPPSIPRSLAIRPLHP